MSLPNRARITDVVLGLDHWFDAMRVDWPTPGYGGPVVHWWNHCLAYRGTGLDWRYEGIIAGYLALWGLSGDRRWLDKATRAGDDLVIGQRSDGCWTNSRFELNPGHGGTPHEAACALALLLLARELRALGDPAAERYLRSAQRNLDAFWLGRLWHGPTAMLRDGIGESSFVPNKAATFVEAILLLAELTADDELVGRIAIPTGDHILRMQTRRPKDPLDGAIAQNRFGDRVVASYFPHYVARCVPPLLQLAERTGEVRFRDAALTAAAFVGRVRERDGGSPQVLYVAGKRNRSPRWIAGAGDIVRALYAAGSQAAAQPTVDWILRGARPDGHVATARGFGRVVPLLSRRDRFADELGVVGWCDKAFRALASLADPARLTMRSPGETEAVPESEAPIAIGRVVR